MTALENEIYDQPQVINHFIKVENHNIKQIAAKIQRSFEYILIAARGSSDNAARYAQYLFGTHNHYPVALATPSLFTIYKQPPRLTDALVIGISQSGQSPDIVQVLLEGKNQRRPTIAITNNDNSPLANSADYVINLQAGEEKAVAASKTYTTSLAALVLLSAHLQKNNSIVNELSEVPMFMQNALESFKDQINRIERYRYMTHCAVIGRGMNYATSFEIALKIKELTHTVAEPYSSADFRHGPIALVQDGFPILVIAPSGEVSSDIKDLTYDILRRKGELILISDQNDLLDSAHLPLRIPEHVPEYLSPLVAVIPGQLFSLYLAIVKGLDPDNPKGIQKITETV